jgi:NAD dependent epimerase/dehydratase family enzyme
VSWIQLDDLVGLYLLALDDARAAGTLNAVGPEPCRMDELCHAIGRVLSRPSWLPVPAAVLKAGFGEAATVLLDGQRVLPRRALALGYRYAHASLEAALAASLHA